MINSRKGDLKLAIKEGNAIGIGQDRAHSKQLLISSALVKVCGSREEKQGCKEEEEIESRLHDESCAATVQCWISISVENV